MVLFFFSRHKLSLKNTHRKNQNKKTKNKSQTKICLMPYKQKAFCPDKKSYQDSVVFVSLVLQHFKVFAQNINVRFLNTSPFESLPRALYLRISCLACLYNDLVTTNFISCCEQSELVLIILHAQRFGNFHSFQLLTCLPQQPFVKKRFVIRTRNTLIYLSCR